ncbi:hypothetical protein COMA2_170062 [Candidatus Nitrospira nitrificans]|uniref:Uncharacterized protein n=1 Tax=Candidatus Nitrospira nitrificans TaxID=1742973 RepID=A0A0S4LCH1_9BACT|nr:hypothetical protein COMA2_170062 [Candidatus Nitrospira nitrificans]
MARESSSQNIMIGYPLGDLPVGNIIACKSSNIAKRHFSEISFISSLCMAIPLAGENTLAAKTLQRDAKSADAGKQVNEGKPWSIDWRERQTTEVDSPITFRTLFAPLASLDFELTRICLH